MNPRSDAPDGIPVTGITTGGGNPAILQILGGGDADQEVIRISKAGELFWNGREVETDADFRAAMLDLAKHLLPQFVVSQRGAPQSETATPSADYRRGLEDAWRACGVIQHKHLDSEEVDSGERADGAADCEEAVMELIRGLNNSSPQIEPAPVCVEVPTIPSKEPVAAAPSGVAKRICLDEDTKTGGTGVRCDQQCSACRDEDVLKHGSNVYLLPPYGRNDG